MQRFIYILKKTVLFLFLCVFLCSCLEIKEDIYITKHGNGKYKIAFDFSDNANSLNVLKARYESANDSLIRAGYPTDSLYISPFLGIDSLFSIQEKKISKVKGISNINKNLDSLTHIYEISFEYSTIEALNNVLHANTSGELSWKKGELSRPLGFWLNRTLKSVLRAENNLEQTKFLMRFYNRMNFQTSLHVPKKIKKYDNNMYLTSSNNTTLTCKLRLSEILDDIIDYSLTVKYK